MRVLIWEQHFLGAGHFFRMAEIARALACRHQVHILLGGREPSVSDLPDGVKRIALAVVGPRKHGQKTYIQREASLDSLMAEDGGDVQAVIQGRRDQMLQLIGDVRPHVLVTEYFPLGRRLFAEELLPAIRMIRSQGGRLVCSVRDILQGDVRAYIDAMVPGPEKEHTLAFHRAAVADLNTWYDLLMVHGDADFIPLRRTLPAWMLEEIQIPVHYTGYVGRRTADASPTNADARGLAAESGYVVVSVGSGGASGGDAFSHGAGAIAPSIDAWKALAGSAAAARRKMVIFVGTEASAAEYKAIRGACSGDRLIVRPASKDFPDWLGYADLSISRAGYNTCVDLMLSSTRAILLPSRANTDQDARARELAKQGLATVLYEDELTTERLQQAIVAALAGARPRGFPALDGAEQAARLIEGLSP